MEFVPSKPYYKIREVSEITSVEAHVLRFWETEFPALAPPKSRNGRRAYRPKDIELILEIRKLLYEDGYTITDARRRMEMREPAAAPKKRTEKKKPKSSASAAKPVKPPDSEPSPLFDFDFDEDEEIDDAGFGEDFEEFEEDEAVAAPELVESRELRPPSFTKYFEEALPPQKAATSPHDTLILRDTKLSLKVRPRKAATPPPHDAAGGKRPTSERLKRVQTELDNILTLLDHE